MNQLLRERVGDVERDDRVLPVTVWSGRVIAPVLLLAFLSLYGFPDRTTEYFAWTIRPDLTPLIMGAGYGAGAYYFARVITIDEWHRVELLFPGIAAFTWAMAFATILHWENFNHGHFSTAIWVFLYVVTPLLIPALWYVNRQTDPGEVGEDDQVVPRFVRRASAGLGVVVTLVAAVFFLVPDVMIDTWPWAVSPLTSRVLAGWAAVFGVASLVFSFDPRWSSARIPVQSLAIWFGLILLGVVRARGDLDASNPIAWVLIGGMVAYLLGVSALYVHLERR